MKKDTNSSLLQSLSTAILSCDCKNSFEEEGGFILHKADSDEYKFVKITNRNTGSPVAKALYTAEKQEYGDKVLVEVLKHGWTEFASFHTHPPGFGPFPSEIDLQQLFTGFPINYIYSPDMNLLMQYTLNKETKQCN